MGEDRDADALAFVCDVVDDEGEMGAEGSLPPDAWMAWNRMQIGPGLGPVEPFAYVLKGRHWRKSDTKAGAVAGALRLGVHFLDGSAALQAHTLAIAAEWTGFDGANVTFSSVPMAQSDIRVTFATDRNESLVGRLAKQAPHEPTMWLGRASLSAAGAPTAVMRRVVRHEFGHAMGLSHEHQHPEAPYIFDEAALLAYFLGRPWGGCQSSETACRASIAQFITGKFAASEILVGAFDARSVMNYPLLDEWVAGPAVAENPDISTYDRQVVAALYP